jgi:hypothetical protein
MTPNMKCLRAFTEGMAATIVAHLTAWLLLASAERIWYLVGHIAAVLGIYAVELLFR